MPSFWVDPSEVYGDKVILLGDEAHHLSKVRRCLYGDVIDVTNGRGDFFKVRLEEITSERVEGVIVERFFEKSESAVGLHLAPSLIKGSRFDGLVEKSTEVGVKAIYPHFSHRAIPESFSKRKMIRWQRMAKAAVKQSGRSIMPEIYDPVDYSTVLKVLVEKCEIVFVGVLGERPLPESLFGMTQKRVINIGLMVGPEGGFTSNEISEAIAVGAVPFSWGNSVLRSDTAGAVFSALLISLSEKELQRKEGLK